jgi:multidrug efflux pump subunit AcrA (membrane-fusion protein)
VGFRLPRGRKRVWWAAGAIVLAAAGAGAWLVITPSAAEPPADSMTVAATRGTQRQTVDASGTVGPAARADLEFAVSGEVTAVLVAEGDTVTKGQVLATVDDEVLRAEVTAADANLDAAQARHDDDVAAGASDTQLAADGAAVVSAQSKLAAAQESLNQASLRATIAGTVADVGLAVGDQVSGGDGSSPSDGSTSPSAAPDDQSGEDTTAITVVSTGRFVVDASVAGADVAKVKKGQQVEVTPVDATQPVAGTVTAVGLVAEADDSGAATFPVTIAVTGTHDDVYAGSSATVAIVVEERADVLTVPTQAVHGEGDDTYVYEMAGGARVKTAVRIGTAYGPQTEIVSGLAEGDEVELAGFVRRPSGDGGENDGNGGQVGVDEGPQLVPGGGMMPGGGK